MAQNPEGFDNFRPRNTDRDGSIEHTRFTGLNNRTPVERLLPKTLSSAMNVDLDEQGQVSRRPGFTAAYTGAGLHSLWSGGDYLLCVEGTQLKRLTVAPSGAITGAVLGSGFMPGKHLAYGLVNGEVYLSNGVMTGKVTTNGLVAWGVQTPAGQPALTADTVGGLHNGVYQVAVTFVTASGEESGAQVAQEIAIAEGGGILVTSIPQPTETSVTGIRIYVSPPNEDVLYLTAQLAVGVTATYVYRWDTGAPLQTMHLDKMPPSTSIANLGGRIYGALGNVLYWTEPLRYGLYHPAANWMQFPGAIKAIADVENGGLYVIGEKTWFLSGAEPDKFERTEVLGYGGPEQQILRVPREAFTKLDVGIADVPVWLSARGFHAGLPSGVVNLTEKEVVVDSYKRIAALYREQNGRRQVIATGANPERSAIAMGDNVVAQIRRNGVII